MSAAQTEPPVLDSLGSPGLFHPGAAVVHWLLQPYIWMDGFRGRQGMDRGSIHGVSWRDHLSGKGVGRPFCITEPGPGVQCVRGASLTMGSLLCVIEGMVMNVCNLGHEGGSVVVTLG